MERVLVLNASFEPLNVVSIKRAVVLLVQGKAEVVSQPVYPLGGSATLKKPMREIRKEEVVR